ncbi:T9SS type A sorting domain-containing protein [Hymenobacter tibetensis]|uniref:T9SS type A sorting domain-containing protein n=1 Tax=Hymenobacter tibetensis TaxID=497967 RepID=A0ABY4CZV1_9BACT|nr:T9SS type A sorting domain-containing protein [Hymenobacter tibetensis]UOG75801.1 T9SS type A sorting domain-containing protein [Hymenobacter tibetensis]
MVKDTGWGYCWYWPLVASNACLWSYLKGWVAHFVDDAASIPAGLAGYVSSALDLINAYYTLTQVPYDSQPILHAAFKPAQYVTRADFVVIVSRTFPQYNALTQPAARSAATTSTTLAPSAAAILTKETVAYPNPFTGSTTISYYLTQNGLVTVEIYNAIGRKVQTLVSGTETASFHQVQFKADNLSNGTYLFKVKTAESVATKRLVLQQYLLPLATIKRACSVEQALFMVGVVVLHGSYSGAVECEVSVSPVAAQCRACSFCSKGK